MSPTQPAAQKRKWWQVSPRSPEPAPERTAEPAPERTAEPEPVDHEGPDIVAISPHQDDETLTLGPAILDAVAAGKSVAVLLVSRGDASRVRVRQLPKHLGFTPSPHHFSAMRDREFDGAVTGLGATPIIAPYEQRLPDGGATVEAVTELIRAQVARGTEVMTISIYDEHPDHQACGRAVGALVDEGYLSRAAYFISPERLDRVPEGISLERVGQPITLKHQEPYRTRDVANNWWGIGLRSVRESFDYQVNDDPLAYRHT